MDCTKEEFRQDIEEEDIKFIRLAFCDVFGTPKNISVMPSDLARAFKHGIPFNGSFINGFAETTRADLFLHPDVSTTTLLPWRPDHGKVIRMFCDITYQDGKIFSADTRNILKEAIKTASEKGIDFTFGSRMEFYLFKTDDEGEPTNIPYDKAGYMDIAPLDKGENVRREICLTLEQMGINPVNSHHEAGPGQNEIDFMSADPLKAADDTVTFITVVKTIAARNGLYADFSPKPIAGQPGNGFHINVSAKKGDDRSILPSAIAGIMEKIYDSTIFFNRCEDSYQRIGKGDAPRYISWGSGNFGQLIRIPQVPDHHYAQLRSPDAFSNPYLMFALIIYSGLYGIENDLQLASAANYDLKGAGDLVTSQFKHLPRTIEEAKEAAKKSEFIRSLIPDAVIDAYCR